MVLAWLAFLWAVGNSIYVYLMLGGERTYRVESAAYILAGVLVPLIFWRPAALCFAIFLFNPLQMEAVLWVSGLQELLWTFFVLAGLVVYTGTPVLSPWRSILTVTLVACALLAKETAVASALLLPVSDWTLFRMRRGTWLPAMYAAVLAVIAGYLLLRARVISIEV